MLSKNCLNIGVQDIPIGSFLIINVLKNANSLETHSFLGQKLSLINIAGYLI